MRAVLVSLAILALSRPALAQHQHPTAPAGSESPIKSLSQAQIADLKHGRGAGLALVAELNGYPGPTHVLELKEKLGLTPHQRTKMEELVSAMRAEAIALGNKLVEQEALLDRQFATRAVTSKNLAELTQEIANTQGSLRTAHLRYHLETIDVLTPSQVAQYVQLRGHRGGGHDQHKPR